MRSNGLSEITRRRIEESFGSKNLTIRPGLVVIYRRRNKRTDFCQSTYKFYFRHTATQRTEMGERDYGGYDSHPPAAARFPLKKASTEKLFEYMNRVIYVTYDVKERRVAACPQLADYRDFPFSVLGNK